ncbi:hypothetical protein V474_05360 [Novosphingobium barchaimii LL02]|uniref:Aldehyde dehydrogenase domain-containing protein n=1 Tax=Novosphingobium barchaimii LL02 TaxID=1114963 RepID=A0A0J7XGX7_9SPHN|nr:aldehyde dehydrogenase family protein [Novosphingobium barchaimii]KMS50929.1 hypothetical protein V474_05360 [Novosphingobium barchaimii LL02]
MALHDPNEAVLAHVGGQHRLFIDNEWHDAASGKTFEVRNPATGTVVAHVAEGDARDIDRAVQAARRAFDERRWQGLTPEKRADVMWKLAELFERDARTIAEIEVVDNGMPIAFAEWMVGSVVQGLKYYAGMVTKLQGRNVSPALASCRRLQRYWPLLANSADFCSDLLTAGGPCCSRYATMCSPSSAPARKRRRPVLAFCQ